MKIEKRILAVPLTAQLEVTDICNHRCIHCYNLDSKIENRPIRKVSDEIVLACAQRLIDSGIFSVVITGGEPLIKKDLTKKIILLFKGRGIQTNLNSNLTLFDDDFIAFLRDNKIGVLTSCPSSIATSFERLVGVDNYSKFEKNLKKLLEAEVRVNVNMVVTKDNIHEIRATAEKMKNLGCKSFAATPMGLNMEYPRLDLLLSIDDIRKVIVDLLWAEEALELKVDILEALPKCAFPEKILNGRHSFLNRKCQAGRTVIAVSCNGDVRPCAHNPIPYGNILEESLNEIWLRMEDWRSNMFVPLACKGCSWLSKCNGGCRTSAKTINGEWFGKDPWATTTITRPTKKDKRKSELSIQTILHVNKNYHIRQDDTDVFVVYNTANNIYFMVNKMLLDFIVGLSDVNEIGVGDLAEKYNTTIDNLYFSEIISYLVQKRILQIVAECNDFGKCSNNVGTSDNIEHMCFEDMKIYDFNNLGSCETGKNNCFCNCDDYDSCDSCDGIGEW